MQQQEYQQLRPPPDKWVWRRARGRHRSPCRCMPHHLVLGLLLLVWAALLLLSEYQLRPWAEKQKEKNLLQRQQQEGRPVQNTPWKFPWSSYHIGIWVGVAAAVVGVLTLLTTCFSMKWSLLLLLFVSGFALSLTLGALLMIIMVMDWNNVEFLTIIDPLLCIALAITLASTLCFLPLSYRMIDSHLVRESNGKHVDL